MSLQLLVHVERRDDREVDRPGGKEEALGDEAILGTIRGGERRWILGKAGDSIVPLGGVDAAVSLRRRNEVRVDEGPLLLVGEERLAQLQEGGGDVEEGRLLTDLAPIDAHGRRPDVDEEGIAVPVHDSPPRPRPGRDEGLDQPVQRHLVHSQLTPQTAGGVIAVLLAAGAHVGERPDDGGIVGRDAHPHGPSQHRVVLQGRPGSPGVPPPRPLRHGRHHPVQLGLLRGGSGGNRRRRRGDPLGGLR
mmetsp:Transcript_15919/g.38040  ORF Transcript_15919/g.38040 Transcript_15919/m.38040 type:complete len:247 (-) Transcript_15919:127-867(-)